jgi:hypothetical protein
MSTSSALAKYAWLFYDNSETSTALRTQFFSLASQYSNIIFSQLDYAVSQNIGIANSFGITKAPAVLFLKGGTKYNVLTNPTLQNVPLAVKDFSNGIQINKKTVP